MCTDKQPLPAVVAHANMSARFERYLLMRGYNSVINTRQFRQKSSFPQRYPTITSTYTVRHRARAAHQEQQWF